MSWEDLLQRPGQSDGSAEFLLSALNGRSARRQNDAQTQLINAEMQQKQQANARDLQFQSDWAQYSKNPTPQALLDLQGKYPEKAQGISKIYDAKDTAARTSDLSYFGSLYSALTPNKGGKLVSGADGKPLAAGVLSQRIAADKAAGLDTSQEEQYLQLIQSGDPEAANTLRGMILPHLAASAGPDKFASAYGAVTKPEEGYTLGPGMQRRDQNNNVVASAPFAPQYKNVGQGDKLFEVGGGGQGSGASGTGAPSGPRRVGGYSPRASAGGDNSDAAVDGKLTTLNQITNVGIDTPLKLSDVDAIAAAIPSTEGKPAAKNNVGNIQNGAFAKSQKGYAGADGRWATFDTPENGQLAVRNLLRKKFSNGFATMRDMIEGKVVGGDAAPQDGAAPGAKLVAVGDPKPDATATDYVAGTDVGGMSAAAIDNAARRYNLTGQIPASLGRKGEVQRAILSRAAQFANGTDTGDQIANQAGRAADVAALKKLEGSSANILSFERTALRNGALALRLSARNDNGGVPIFNSWINAGRRATGDVNISSFDAAVETFANEYAKVTTSATGGGVTSDSAREHARSLINTAQTPDQFIGVIQTLAEDMRNRRRGLESQRQEIMNRIAGPKSQPAAPSSGWGKAVKVN